MASFEIKAYSAQLYSGAHYAGLIHLYGASDNHVASAHFTQVGAEVPAPRKDANGLISLYYPHEAFAFIIDILRNEKPCYLTWGTISGSIGTSREPVGENEATAPLQDEG